MVLRRSCCVLYGHDRIITVTLRSQSLQLWCGKAYDKNGQIDSTTTSLDTLHRKASPQRGAVAPMNSKLVIFIDAESNVESLLLFTNVESLFLFTCWYITRCPWSGLFTSDPDQQFKVTSGLVFSHFCTIYFAGNIARAICIIIILVLGVLVLVKAGIVSWLEPHSHLVAHGACTIMGVSLPAVIRPESSNSRMSMRSVR